MTMKMPAIGPRWACSFFFAVVGLVYGSVMSRMPALKAQAFLNDADVGMVLLCMGLGGLCSFPLAGWAIARTSCRTVLMLASAFLIALFPCMGLVSGLFSAALLFALLGFAIGVNDVGINAGSILVESSMRRPVISSMHALYSSGGLLGALFGSCMAAAGVPPLGNFLGVALVLLCLLPFFACNLLHDIPRGREKGGSLRRPPLWVLVFGLLLLCSYSSEGSVGEWGVLLLHEVKGATEQTAALAYAAFSIAMVGMRFFGDRLREHFGDSLLMRVCSGCALGGMLTALLSPWPALCLAGYAFMGLGLSVTVPVLFSAAGRRRDLPTGTVTAFLSMLAASGQLFIPPLIGMLGAAVGLQTAMGVVVLLCAVLFFGAGVVRK
ncbi:MFS transporter [Mailhella massiliensis]|uniref:MFS transporter n=1 Tax=Mailhella massiliensis TaxID=1903261 RepID=A0A921DQL1_9BACT|nr:MFS transporter [Mailhella massiliensis]HJD96051.1 MFS transporter [Mailhella massiliensis]